MTDILLLEDDESVNRGIEFTLQKAGYHIVSVFTISQAKQILKQEAEIPMMICDVNLSDGNGTDLIHPSFPSGQPCRHRRGRPSNLPESQAAGGSALYVLPDRKSPTGVGARAGYSHLSQSPEILR